MAGAVKISDSLISRDKTVNRRKICEVHYHEEHELYYMQEGQTTYFIDDEIFHVEKGEFVFVPKGALHRTDSGNCKRNARILLNFPDSVFTGEGAGLYQELCRYPVGCVAKDKERELEELFIKIEREYRRKERYGELLMHSYILELLVQICRYRCERKTKIRESDQVIYEITAYIGENYGGDISLQKISRQFSISESYLSRKFKSVTGIGINRYITFVRISNAEKMLRDGGVSVAQAARNCGYNDSNYFSTVYQKVKGVTPSHIVRGRERSNEP